MTSPIQSPVVPASPVLMEDHPRPSLSLVMVQLSSAGGGSLRNTLPRVNSHTNVASAGTSLGALTPLSPPPPLSPLSPPSPRSPGFTNFHPRRSETIRSSVTNGGASPLLCRLECPFSGTESSETVYAFCANLPPALDGRVSATTFDARVTKLNQLLSKRNTPAISDPSLLLPALVFPCAALAAIALVCLFALKVVSIIVLTLTLLPLLAISYFARALLAQKPKYLQEVEKEIDSWNLIDQDLCLRYTLLSQPLERSLFSVTLVLEINDTTPSLRQRATSGETVRNSLTQFRARLGLPAYESPAPSYRT